MASRSVWKGSLALGPMLTLHLEALKGTDKYAGSMPLKEVCSCHLKPFARETQCAESGVQRGTGNCEMVKAVEKPDGTFAEVDPALIELALAKDEMQTVAIVPRTTLPLYALDQFWMLRPSKKVAGADQAAGFVLAWLEARETALVVRMPYGGHVHLAAIYANEDHSLGMSRLRYAAELREAEKEVLDVGLVEVPDRALAMIDEIVKEVPTNLNLAVEEDPSVAERSRVIAQVLGGEAPTPAAETAEPAQSTPDLMAALEGAMAGRSKPTKKTTTKAGAKAPANA